MISQHFPLDNTGQQKDFFFLPQQVSEHFYSNSVTLITKITFIYLNHVEIFVCNIF